jgi:WD40 repeat protein
VRLETRNKLFKNACVIFSGHKIYFSRPPDRSPFLDFIFLKLIFRILYFHGNTFGFRQSRRPCSAWVPSSVFWVGSTGFFRVVCMPVFGLPVLLSHVAFSPRKLFQHLYQSYTYSGPNLLGSTQAHIFDIATQQVLESHSLGQDPVHCLAIDKTQGTPGANKLLSGGRQICLWDLERVDAGPLLTVKEQHRGIVNCLELVDDIIFCTHKGKKIRLWDSKSGKRLHTLAGHDHLVHCFGVNGNILASGSKDKTVRIWDRRQTFAPVVTLDCHKSSVRALALDKWKLVTGSKAGQVSIHNLYDLSSPPATFNNYECVYSVAIDDSRALIGSSILRMYDFANAPKSILASCSVS